MSVESQMAGGKVRYPRAAAVAVARELVAALREACEPERLIVAGSLRRRKAEVGDVELVYVSRCEVRRDPADMFAMKRVELVDLVVGRLEREGVLEKRTNARGSVMFGEKNKLVRHVRSGIPVDLFAATEFSWWNYLVCRTGPGESNIRIASAAKERGWKWNPYGPGFTRMEGLGMERHQVHSEREVFEFVGLEYREAWER